MPPTFEQRLKGFQEDFDSWSKAQALGERATLRALEEQARAEDPAASTFTLKRFCYQTLLEQGFPQPSLIRKINCEDHTNSPTELVSSPSFGAGGYHFLLSQFAICPSEEKVALAGSVGGTAVLCIREPSLGKTNCTEAPEIGGLAWDSSCATVLYTHYENGRAAKISAVPASALSTPRLLLEESDQAFSYSLSLSEDGHYFVISSCSAERCELRVASANELLGAPPVVLPRSSQRSVRLHRSQNSWWAVESLAGQDSKVASVATLSPLTLAKDIPLGEFKALRARGFDSFLFLEGRMDALPAAAIIERAAGIRSLPLPSAVQKMSVLPVQNYTSQAIRLSVAGPTLKAQRVDLLRNGDVTPLTTIAGIRLFTTETSSPDGTKIPLTVFWKPDSLGKNAIACRSMSLGNTTTLHEEALCPSRWVVKSYGAYGESLDLESAPMWRFLLDQGIGIVAAHVRGGGEKGPAWHAAARGTKRLRSVEDLIATLKALRPAKVVLSTRSAGGLIGALAMHQAPELFAGALLEAPFLEVLGTLDDTSRPSSVRETAEWGDPKDPAVRLFWKQNSPEYLSWNNHLPPLFISLGENDAAISSRYVVSWLSRILEAAAPRDSAPLLQWVAHGTHAGAQHESEEALRQAQQLVWITQALGEDSPRRTQG
jgi:protease II